VPEFFIRFPGTQFGKIDFSSMARNGHRRARRKLSAVQPKNIEKERQPFEEKINFDLNFK
jgi:hypothetical protein